MRFKILTFTATLLSLGLPMVHATDLSAGKRPTRDAKSFAEVTGKEVVMPTPRLLNMEGYNGDEKIAFAADKKDGCVFTLTPVENFPQTGGYALPETEMKWQVGEYQEGKKITSPETCKELPFLYRSDCIRKTKDAAGLVIYQGPDSIQLKSSDTTGKLLMVYTREARAGAINCMRNHAFNLPQYDVPDTGTHTAAGSTTVGR